MSLTANNLGTTSISGGSANGAFGSSVSGFSTTTNNSVLIGQNCAPNNTAGFSNTYVGNYAAENSTQGSGNVLVGFDAAQNLFGDNNLLIGTQVAAHGSYISGGANVAVGNYAAPSLSSGYSNVLVGIGSDVIGDGNFATAVGAGAKATTHGMAVGPNAEARQVFSLALGSQSKASGHHSVAAGYKSAATGSNSVALGYRSTSIATSGVAIGDGAYVQGANSVAIGTNARANDGGSINIINRLMGYYSPVGVSSNYSTYVVQANVDALKLTGGGMLSFCPGPGGFSNNKQLDPAPQWAVGVSSNDLVFTSSNGAVVKLVDDFRPGLLDFTAQHRCVWTNQEEEEAAALLPIAGRVMIATGKYRSASGGSTVPTADEAVPMVEMAREPNDPRAFGVLSSDPAEEYRLGHLVFQKESHDDTPFVVVNSAGEGGIWVSDERGPIRNGDLVTTGSSIPGVAVRQEDDLVRSYTVAKITCDCDFDRVCPGPVVVLSSSRGILRVCLLGCTYKV